MLRVASRDISPRLFVAALIRAARVNVLVGDNKVRGFMGYLKKMWRENESMFLLFALMVIAHMCTGCSTDVQRVCTSGDESDAVEYAVEYWTQRGHAVMVANDGCTIRTRLADNRVGGYTWGETQYGEHYFSTDLEPSHTIQSELRLRAEWWPLERVQTAVNGYT